MNGAPVPNSPKHQLAFDIDYHMALAGLVSEWNSEEDDEAFRDL